MSNKILSNFEFENSEIDLNKTIEVKWLNDGSVQDFNLNLVNSTFLGFNESYNKEIEKQWRTLKKRSENFLNQKHLFSFLNSKVIRWEGFLNSNPNTKLINVSKGIDYKKIISIRSREKLFSKLNLNNSPRAFVVVNIFISSDNKLILGKRKHYGDWPFDTYECPGAFLHEEDLNKNSLIKIAQEKVLEDYKIYKNNFKTMPIIIYYFPRILEMVLLCVTKTPLSSEEMNSEIYSKILPIDNTMLGLKKLTKMNLNQFHPPSRIAIQFYMENFLKIQKLLKN